MKIPRIANAMNNIDGDLINEATEARTVKNRKTVWIRWGSVAACLAVISAAVAITAPRLLKGNEIVPHDDGEMPAVSDGKTGAEFAGDNVLEKYYDYVINGGMFSIYTRGKVIAEDKIGKKIEDVVVTAGWKNGEGEWISTENLSAEVYEIEGIETDVGVALKFIDQGEALTTTHYYEIKHPNAEYNGMKFPDYKAENPIRYLEEGDMGKSNGWQDIGLGGEIRTVTVPVESSFVYQTYSYYIRNDLSHIYSEEDLPKSLGALPSWLSDTAVAGRKAFWYSMANRIPEDITLVSEAEIISENGEMRFIKAEYKIHTGEKEEDWIVYFMEEGGVYSAFAAVANQNFDLVKAYTETIVKSYQAK